MVERAGESCLIDESFGIFKTWSGCANFRIKGITKNIFKENISRIIKAKATNTKWKHWMLSDCTQIEESSDDDTDSDTEEP